MQARGLPVDFWHTPDGEPEGGTRFLCRTMTEREFAKCFMMCETIGGEVQMRPDGLMYALDCGLKGWENFTDERGQPLPFTPQNVQRIPSTEQVRIANLIINNSSLTDEEKKQLSTPSKSATIPRVSAAPSA